MTILNIRSLASLVTNNQYIRRKRVFISVPRGLPDINFISFTTDHWSALNKDQFMSLTAHCTFDNFEQQAVVLHTEPMNISHTGLNINETMNKMITEFDIPKYKVHNIVHDNCSNMVVGIDKTSEYDSLPCFIHTTQLCIEDCVLSQRSVIDIIAKCKTLASHFSRSIPSLHKLESIQVLLGYPKLRLITDVITRWDSKYLMISRTLDMRRELVIYINENNFATSFSPNEWDLMEKLVTLLKAFHQVTKSMSERYANSSQIIPQTKVLKYFVKDTVTKLNLTGLGTTLDSLEKSFKTRLGKYLENENCILATYLDPKFKFSAFKDEDPQSIRGKEAIQLLVIEKYIQYESDKKQYEDEKRGGDSPMEDHPINVSQISQCDFSGFPTEEDKDKEKGSDINQIYDMLFSEPDSNPMTVAGGSSSAAGSSTVTASRLRLQNEMECYNTLTKLDKNGNSFEWWKQHKLQLPLLSMLASKYLSSPPSSVESERTFSIGGNVVTRNRNRLRADNTEKLIFLNANLPLLPSLDYTKYY